jgi:2',3'-cyclic-nucleotide 2'-phosphodiesterase (5'-nucleotidase family)
MRRWLAVVAVALVVWGCSSPPKTARSGFTLAFTNDRRGELAPCDCSGGAAGGLSRQAGYLRELRAKQPSLVAVEAGDFLYAVWPETDAEKTTEHARALIAAGAYARAGYDAVLFGARDYALGVDALREIATKIGPDAVVGANVTDARTGRPLWPASKIVTRDGVRVGVVGLMTNKKDIVPPGRSWPADVIVEDPLAAAKRVIPELRRRCDVLILLANLDRDELEPLLKAAPGVDFVVKSREAKIVTSQVEQLAKTPLLGLYELGHYVGRLEITVVQPGKPYGDLAEEQILERKIERYRAYVDAIDQKAGGADRVEHFYAGDELTLERYRRYRDSVDRWEHERERLKPTGNRYSYELIELDNTRPETPEVRAAVIEFERVHGAAQSAREAQMQRHGAGTR